MPKIKVNGQEIEAAPGKRLLEVLTDNGVDVPHYCWHPGLSPHGNCRMCLCKVSNSRKLEVACMVAPSDNLEVTTEGPEIDTARKAVMEYLLVNHPLDCPICDKAGECRLQDYTFAYRHGLTRFCERKVVRHTKDLGPKVKVWGSRCISCTRCVRFCKEITGTSELTMAYRGDHQVVDTHPGTPLDNPMSLNVVDICPVGALNDKHFLYATRVWFAKKHESTCAGCSRGCSISATVHKSEIKRIQPRFNPEVNGYWMCDPGRETDWISASNRLKNPKGTVKDLAAAVAPLKGALGIIASTAATLEELHLVRGLATALGARVGFLSRSGERWVAKSGFTIESDKTPNRKGVERVFGSVDGWEPIAKATLAGEIRGLLVLNSIPNLSWPEELVKAAQAVECLAIGDLQSSPLAEKAKFVVPSTCWAEMDGTFMNRDGRISRIRPLVPAPGQARPAAAWLQDLLIALGVRKTSISAEGVFREVIAGLDYAKVGNLGTASTTSPDAPTDPMLAGAN